MFRNCMMFPMMLHHGECIFDAQLVEIELLILAKILFDITEHLFYNYHKR